MRKALYVLFLVLLPLWAISQEIFSVENITRKEGLHEREVIATLRNDDGYFYLFMLSGVQRWDGQVFENINIDELSKSGKLISDFEGFSTLGNGKIIIEGKGDHTFYIDKSGLEIHSLPNKGRYFVSQNKFYTVQENQENTFNVLRGSDVHQDSLSVFIKNLSFEPRDVLVWKDKVFLNDGQGVIYKVRDGNVTNFRIKGQLIENGNDLYLFSETAIFKWRNQNFELIKNFQYTNLYLRTLKKDKKQNIIFSYGENERYQAHLYILTPDEKILDYNFMITEFDVFIDFHTDNIGYKWFFVGHNGISVITLLRDGSWHFMVNESKTDGEFGKVITSILPGKDSTMFFTIESGGAFTYDILTDSIYPTFPELQPLFTSNGYMHKSPYDQYIYGSRYDLYPNSSDIIRFSLDSIDGDYSSVATDIDVNDVMPIGKDIVLVGGYQVDSLSQFGVLGRYNFSTKTMDIVMQDTLPSVTSLYEDQSAGEYWVGTVNGLYRLDKDFKTIFKFSSENSKTQSYHIKSTIRYKDYMIAGTLGGGVFIIDTDNNEIIKIIRQEAGLSDINAVSFLPLKDDIWVGTFNGITVLDSSFNIKKVIEASEGLVNREFNTKSIARDFNGHIYLGSINGLQKIDPEKIMTWKPSQDIELSAAFHFQGDLIERLNWDGENINISNFTDSIAFWHNWNDYVKYPLESNRFEIVGDCDCPLEYRLTGRNIIISNIPTHGFQLSIVDFKTKNVLKTVNVNYSLDYSRWIQIFGGLALIGLLSYIFSTIYININKKIEADKTEINRRFANLRLSALQSQMNPHFIFNSLGAIQYFIQINNEEMADEYLSNFALLMRKILEASKEKYITIEDEVQLLKLYLNLEELRFEDKFTSEIIVDDNVDSEAKLPPMMIQPFIENAINHGLNHLSGRDGKVTIHFQQSEKNWFKCIIEDNGIGREAASKYARKNHKSRGMQIIQERIETFNMSTNYRLAYHIEDKIDDAGNACGTRVVISFRNIYE